MMHDCETCETCGCGGGKCCGCYDGVCCQDPSNPWRSDELQQIIDERLNTKKEQDE